jgi:glucokinase
MNQDAFIGVDIGGTHLRVALVDGSGTILESRKTEVRIDLGAEAASEKLLVQCEDLAEFAVNRGFHLKAVGLAVAGKIDKGKGRVVFSPNLPALDDYPLGCELRDKMGIPVFMENDANAFGLGESWAGAAKGIDNWIGITLGTGVGGCLFLNGVLWEGDGLGFSGEVGHMIVEPGGPGCLCGSSGCLEAFASSRALVAEAEKLISAGSAGEALYNVWKKHNLSAESIFECARWGDRTANEIFGKMGWALGIALANLFTVLGIRHALIGGGVSGAWAQFIGPLRSSLSRNISMLDPNRAVILRGSLGDDAALIGAAGLARKTKATHLRDAEAAEKNSE